LGPMGVPLSAEMGRTELPLGEAESIRVGDVICMDNRKSDPCVVSVGGVPKYYAHPFATENGDIKLQVVGTVPRELQ